MKRVLLFRDQSHRWYRWWDPTIPIRRYPRRYIPCLLTPSPDSCDMSMKRGIYPRSFGSEFVPISDFSIITTCHCTPYLQPPFSFAQDQLLRLQHFPPPLIASTQFFTEHRLGHNCAAALQPWIRTRPPSWTLFGIWEENHNGGSVSWRVFP